MTPLPTLALANRWLAAALAAAVALAWPAAGAASPKVASAPMTILVLKRPGIPVFQEVIEEFAEFCRVRARIVNVEGPTAVVHENDVVLAIGQRALDAVPPGSGRVVSAMALRVPYGVIAADARPSPVALLRALKLLRPQVKRLGVVYGKASDALFAQMREPAAALGVTLVKARGADGPEALRQLNQIAGQIDALWLAPDLDVMAPQVFQYALGLEMGRAIPIVGASRQQVRSGALLAVDSNPQTVGRHAALLVNQLLEGKSFEEVTALPHPRSLELLVNGDVARRLGISDAVLRAVHARIE